MKFGIAKSGMVVLSALTLAACAQFGRQAPLDIPTVHSLSQGESVKGQNAWWLQLQDKKLNALIARAVQTSPDLRIAKARFEQAQAQLGITGAAGQPQAGLVGEGLALYAAPKPSSNQGQTDNHLLLANLALQGSWTFDFWGKNRRQVASVLGKRQAVLYEAHQARNELAHAVAAQYFVWQALAEQQALLNQRIELAGKMQQLVKRRINAKLMPSETVYPIELAMQRLELEKIELEKKQLKIRHSLAALTGNTPAGLNIAEPSKAAVVPVLPVGGLYADLLSARPDVAAQKALLTSRYHKVKSAEAEFYPNIELKVLAGLAHIDAFDVVRGKASGVLGVAPALHLPVFTSGALQSRLAGRRAEYNEQVAVYDRTVLNAMRSAADAIADYQSQQAQQPVWEKMLKVAEQSVRSAQGRVRAGLENGLPGMKLQDEVLRLKMQATQQKAELLTAWSNVHLQLGGGFRSNAK
ncbi:efflux transporter outer membrane subunit [Neisseria sp. CCUG12390]|uniref:efflux transporter outer membrane subunit n=1 Tax=Neisseria sp. CCUG12390 TaxID=3392035 RepID=UPI003A0FC19A